MKPVRVKLDKEKKNRHKSKKKSIFKHRHMFSTDGRSEGFSSDPTLKARATLNLASLSSALI